MSLKEPDYVDENGHIVHEEWDNDQLICVEKSTVGEDKNHGYYERINYNTDGKKTFRQVRTPTLNGYDMLEEHYDNGFLLSQTEEIGGNPNIIKFRHFYPQTTPDGTKLDKEILRREEIINRTTGKVDVKEFSLAGEEMVPEKKKFSLAMKWKSKDR